MHQSLPIDKYADEILHRVENSRVVVVSGNTGCGKSTQIPQYLYRYHNNDCRIICTQPRRVACINIAARVSQQLNTNIGGTVGYHIGLEAKQSHQTQILFVTTGIMLNYLVHNPFMLSKIRYIVLDEVHERDLDLDFILMLMKCLLCRFKHIKLIVMSATINAELFSHYFSCEEITESNLCTIIQEASYRQKVYNLRQNVKQETYRFPFHQNKEEYKYEFKADKYKGVGCPHVEIKVQKNYKVDVFYLNELENFWNFKCLSIAKYSEKMLTYDTAHLIEEFVHISLDLILHILKVESYHNYDVRIPKFLIFLPGLSEILYYMQRLDKTIQDVMQTDYEIIPLHSSFAKDYNLTNLSGDKRYFLLATNIAESSITIPDVAYVIDFCLAKEHVTNRNRMSTLELTWSSKASCLQRQGRTGRCNNGYCFYMIPKVFFDGLSDFINPEINRIPLDKIILKTNTIFKQLYEKYQEKNKMIEEQGNYDLRGELRKDALLLDIFSSPFITFNLVIEDLDESKISEAITHLINSKAIIRKEVGNNKSYYENTFLGRLYSELPVQLSMVKLIVFGRAYGCLYDSIRLAAILSGRREFFRKKNDIEKFYEVIQSYSRNQNSDLIVMLNIYKEWEVEFSKSYTHTKCRKKNERRLRNDSNLQGWIKARFLCIDALLDALELYDDIIKKIDNCEPEFLKVDNEKEKPVDYESLKFVIASAFFPLLLKASEHRSVLIDKEVHYVESSLKLNSYNTIKIENSQLKKYIENKAMELSDNDVKLFVNSYERYIVTKLKSEYGSAFKNYKFDNLDLYIEFTPEKASQIIEKILFVANFYNAEKNKVKLFSFEHGNYSTYIQNKLELDTETIIKKTLERLKVEENDMFKQNINIELKTLVDNYSKYTYLHSFEFVDVFQKRDIFLNSCSINRYLKLGPGQEAFLIASDITETSSRRFFCKGITQLPFYESLFEMLLFLFTESQDYLFNNYNTIDSIRFGGIDYGLTFWYDDQDIREINVLKGKFDSVLLYFSPLQSDIDFVKEMISFLRRKRKQYFFNEKWVPRFKLVYKPVNAASGIQLGPMSTEVDHKNHHFYNAYIQWKKQTIADLNFMKRILSLHKARICCKICEERLFDAEDLSPELRVGNLRLLADTRNIFIKQCSLSVCSEELQCHLDLLKNFNYNIVTAYACASNHVIGIGCKTQEGIQIYVVNTIELLIMYPDGTRTEYVNISFNMNEMKNKERIALKKRSEMIQNYHCTICDDEIVFKDHKDLYKHFSSKNHMESYNDFIKLLSN